MTGDSVQKVPYIGCWPPLALSDNQDKKAPITWLCPHNKTSMETCEECGRSVTGMEYKYYRSKVPPLPQLSRFCCGGCGKWARVFFKYKQYNDIEHVYEWYCSWCRTITKTKERYD